ISAATIRSNSPSAKGSPRASPSFTSASAPSGTSPASFIATKSSRTFSSSSTSWSRAMTSAPRRYISKAWRPAPHPMSRTRSPGLSPSRSKSTVSTSFPLGLLGPVVVDHFFVGGRSLLCHGPPAEHVQDPLTPRAAHALAALRVDQQGLEGPRQLPHVTRRHQVGTLTVRADHLGDGPGAGDDQRSGAGHQLGGGQREPLVEGGHAGDLGGPHEPHQLLV